MKVKGFKVLCLIISFALILQVNLVYASVDPTQPPDVANISVANNAGISDTVEVVGLCPYDVVTVYDAAAAGKILGRGIVTKSGTGVKISLTSKIGPLGGSVYVSLTSKGMGESSRTKVDYDAEKTSVAPNVSNISVANNVGTPDIVTVTELSGLDAVYVYSANSGGRLLGKGTVVSSDTEIDIKIPQLGTTAGSIYVSVAGYGMLVSSRTAVSYLAEPKSDDPDGNLIIVTNNAGKPDTVYVSGISEGDVVKVYNAATGGKLLGSSTVSKSMTEATVSISQLGSAAGSVYVSFTSKGMLESNKIKSDYIAEPKTSAPAVANISITNNAGTSDTITISELVSEDVVKVYNLAIGGKLLYSATVPSSKTEATINIPQLGTLAGSVYVTVTSKGMLESTRVKSDYLAEPKTPDPIVANISITNNAGASDTITISALAAYDVVKVYNSAIGGKLLGSATVAASDTDVNITILQLGSIAGSVYVSVTSKGMFESNRIKADYIAEPKSVAPNVGDISVFNYAGISDIVTVTNLSEGDLVKVYNAASGGKLLSTVTADSSEECVTIGQLGTGAGSVYVSITSKNMCESDRTKADYVAELKTTAPNVANITVVNNTDSEDTVNLSGVLEGDVVKIYNAATYGKIIALVTVPILKTEITINIGQLSSAAGSVYVTVTSKGMQESNRVKADYVAKVKTSAPVVGNISVDNNAGISDTVEVSQLSSGDTVYVYNATKGGNLLGLASVGAFETSVTITIPQLGSALGSVYVSVMSKNKLESDRTKVDYSAESKSNTLNISDIIISNNIGKADTLQVSNVSEFDIVKVYSLAKGGRLLGSEKVASFGSNVTIQISQLGSSAGSVYVSVKRYGKLESDRVEVVFDAETLNEE